MGNLARNLRDHITTAQEKILLKYRHFLELIIEISFDLRNHGSKILTKFVGLRVTPFRSKMARRQAKVTFPLLSQPREFLETWDSTQWRR